MTEKQTEMAVIAVHLENEKLDVKRQAFINSLIMKASDILSRDHQHLAVWVPIYPGVTGRVNFDILRQAGDMIRNSAPEKYIASVVSRGKQRNNPIVEAGGKLLSATADHLIGKGNGVRFGFLVGNPMPSRLVDTIYGDKKPPLTAESLSNQPAYELNISDDGGDLLRRSNMLEQIQKAWQDWEPDQVSS